MGCCYYGVRTKMVSKLEDAVGNIAKSGFKVDKSQAYKSSINKNEPGLTNWSWYLLLTSS